MVIRNPSWSRGRFRNGKGRGPNHQQHRIWIDPLFGGIISGSCSLFYWIDMSYADAMPVNYAPIQNPFNFYSLMFQRENLPYWNLGLQSEGHYTALTEAAGRHFVEVRADVPNDLFEIFTDGSATYSRTLNGVQPFSASTTELGQLGFPWAAWLKSWPGPIPPAAAIYNQQIAPSGPVMCQSIVVPSMPQRMEISTNPGVFWELAADGVQFTPSAGEGSYSVAVELVDPIYGTTIPVEVSTTAGQPNSGACSIISTGVCPTYLTVPRTVDLTGDLTYGTGTYAPAGNLTSAAGQPQWSTRAAPATGKYYTIGSLDCSDSGGYHGWSGDVQLFSNGAYVKGGSLSGIATPGYLPLNYLPQGSWQVNGNGITGTITLT